MDSTVAATTEQVELEFIWREGRQPIYSKNEAPVTVLTMRMGEKTTEAYF
jgi:hypothetical protein